MSGGRPKTRAPQKMDPQPSPEPIEEMILAKDKTKRQASRKGRKSNILAGRMMNNVLKFGKARVGE